MTKCVKCLSDNVQGDLYCSYCGAELLKPTDDEYIAMLKDESRRIANRRMSLDYKTESQAKPVYIQFDKNRPNYFDERQKEWHRSKTFKMMCSVVVGMGLIGGCLICLLWSTPLIIIMGILKGLSR